MKKTLLLFGTLVLLSACGNQETKDAKTQKTTDKVEQSTNKTGPDSYESGYKYGEFASDFDHKNGFKQDPNFHKGIAWTKEYSEGYFEGYKNSQEKNNY